MSQVGTAGRGRRARIKGFDALRTIAVGLVILNHNFYQKFNLLTGGRGVQLFFVLSGFLIISILHRRRMAIEQGTTRVGTEIRHFYENRFFRIWPVYFAVLLAAFATLHIRSPEPIHAASWISNVFFVGNIGVAYAWFDWRQVGVFWSLAVEEQFYLWAGLALIFTNVRWHVSICVVVLSMAVVAAALTPQLIASPADAKFSIDTGSLTNFGLIAIGGLATLSLRHLRFTRWLAAPALALYLAGTFIGFPAWASGPLFFVPALLVAIVLAGIAHSQDSLFVKLLDWMPLRYIGQISYGIYLFHGFIHVEYIVPYWLDDHVTVRAIIDTVLAIFIAGLSWRFFEKPILNFRDRRRNAEPGFPKSREAAAS